jgi:ferredoxin
VWIRNFATLGVAVVTLVVLAVLAWRNGRTYCNTICPVGTVLGFLSRFSLLKPVIDTEKCINCNICSKNCKAACIDIPNHKIDYSRCVTCMNCIEKCPKKAISYAMRPAAQKAAPAEAKVDTARRNFLIGAGLVAAEAVRAQEMRGDGGYAVLVDKQAPNRENPITPPGSKSLRNLTAHCTGCQLCVAACPTQILRPSSDLKMFMQPTMSYENGYCRPECNKCSTVCPTGAIDLISVAEKSSVQIGHAVWVAKNCIVISDDKDCGNCERHCPTKAITMVPLDPADPKSRKIPTVNESLCIGCGACEHLCPSRPFSAIYVKGYQSHLHN